MPFPTSNKKPSFNIIYILFVANPFHCQYVIFSQINLKKFLHVCEDLGLSAWQLFDPQDLVAQDNVMWVAINCLSLEQAAFLLWCEIHVHIVD